MAIADLWTLELLLAAFAGPVLALVLAAFAANKVAGFAVAKAVNAVLMLPVAAYFLEPPWQYAAGLLPSYWPLKMVWQATAGEDYLLPLAGALLAHAAAPALDLFAHARGLQHLGQKARLELLCDLVQGLVRPGLRGLRRVRDRRDVHRNHRCLQFFGCRRRFSVSGKDAVTGICHQR